MHNNETSCKAKVENRRDVKRLNNFYVIKSASHPQYINVVKQSTNLNFLSKKPRNFALFIICTCVFYYSCENEQQKIFNFSTFRGIFPFHHFIIM